MAKIIIKTKGRLNNSSKNQIPRKKIIVHRKNELKNIEEEQQLENSLKALENKTSVENLKDIIINKPIIRNKENENKVIEFSDKLLKKLNKHRAVLESVNLSNFVQKDHQELLRLWKLFSIKKELKRDIRKLNKLKKDNQIIKTIAKRKENDKYAEYEITVENDKSGYIETDDIKKLKEKIRQLQKEKKINSNRLQLEQVKSGIVRGGKFFPEITEQQKQEYNKTLELNELKIVEYFIKQGELDPETKMFKPESVESQNSETILTAEDIKAERERIHNIVENEIKSKSIFNSNRLPSPAFFMTPSGKKISFEKEVYDKYDNYRTIEQIIEDVSYEQASEILKSNTASEKDIEEAKEVLNDANKIVENISELLKTDTRQALIEIGKLARNTHDANYNFNDISYSTEGEDKTHLRDVAKKEEEFLKNKFEKELETLHVDMYKKDIDETRVLMKKAIAKRASELLGKVEKGNQLRALVLQGVSKLRWNYKKSIVKSSYIKDFIKPEFKMKLRGAENIFKKPEEIAVSKNKSRIDDSETIKDNITLNSQNKTSVNSNFPKEKSVQVYRARILKKAKIDYENASNVIDLKKINNKILINLFYECVTAATYFQILVANTPMDERYTYQVKRMKYDRLRYTNNKGEERDPDDVFNDMMKSSRVQLVTKTHIPDEESVRGDWVLIYKGHRFKAFKTTPSKYSDGGTFEKTFYKSYFNAIKDEKSIEKMAIAIYETVYGHDSMVTESVLRDSTSKNNNFRVENLNPRWEMLEYGYYKTSESEPKKGAKYSHGLTNHHSYQAPHGFLRLTEAYWNLMISNGEQYGLVSNFLNKNNSKLKVSKISSPLIKQLLELNPDIKVDEFNSKHIRLVED